MSNYDTLERGQLYSGAADLVVQTTSVGMGELSSMDPCPSFSFTGNEIAYELVYEPKETVFLKKAKDAGCRIVNGSQMLMEQGKLQFEASPAITTRTGFRQTSDHARWILTKRTKNILLTGMIFTSIVGITAAFSRASFCGV